MAAYNQTTIEIIDIPQFEKIPSELPWVFDNMSLAHSLGIRNRTLMNLVVNRNSMYKRYDIPKKSGGSRPIHAPGKALKFVQKRVLDRYLNILDYPKHISAYVPGRTTRSSAELHSGKPILIVIDLKDFFTSTRRAWIRQVLNREFGYSHLVAGLLADLMTVAMDFPYGRRYVVPQGAPTSGAICNWVAHYRLDRPILELCEKRGFTYTRYADDLAFSSAERLTRRETNQFIREVTRIIKDARYTVNRKKLRVARSGRQQRLLGMTVNEKPNVMRRTYKNMRARLHHCKHKGFDAVAKEMGIASGALLRSQIEGQIAYFHMINPEKAAKLKMSLLAIETIDD